MWTVARISPVKLRSESHAKKKCSSNSSLSHWSVPPSALVHPGPSLLRRWTNSVARKSQMRRKQGSFPYVKPHSPFVNTKPSTWKDYVASSTGKKYLSSSETVNYIFAQSKQRAGSERNDLYLLGFCLYKLYRTPWESLGYTELYIEMWVTLLVSMMLCASQDIPKWLQPCAFLPPFRLYRLF